MEYIEWLDKGALGREVIGGKGASLSELSAAGFNVPLAFAVNAAGYRRFEQANGLQENLARLAASITSEDRESARRATVEIGELLDAAVLPDDLSKEIASAYNELAGRAGERVAVRSSAISEDGAGASFAGLYESYLNIVGSAQVLESVRRCYCSLWSERALQYRARRGGTAAEAMAVVVMALVPAEVSGVAFTAHPITGDRGQVLINSSWGLGEAIVSGRVTPDSFLLQKEPLGLLEREIYDKELAIYPDLDGEGTVEREPSAAEAAKPSLSDDEALAVARLACDVEKYFGVPQDIEWSIATGWLYLIQARPITTLR